MARGSHAAFALLMPPHGLAATAMSVYTRYESGSTGTCLTACIIVWVSASGGSGVSAGVVTSVASLHVTGLR